MRHPSALSSVELSSEGKSRSDSASLYSSDSLRFSLAVRTGRFQLGNVLEQGNVSVPALSNDDMELISIMTEVY